MLNKDQQERYNRNIIIEDIGIEGQHKLLNSKVLICGAGGLGSVNISGLASSGVGSIGIIDNDRIEISNLNRQFIHYPANIDKLKVESAKEWINKFNPEINVETYPIRLNTDNYAGIIDKYDLVVDCFDSFESKFILNEICVKNNKTLVHAGVTEFYGQVMTIIPQKTPCLGCLFGNYDKDTFKNSIKGVISPVVNIIGSIQCLETVKILLNQDNLLINNFLSYDGTKQKFRKIQINQDKNCLICAKVA